MTDTAAGDAFGRLLATLGEVGERFAGPEWSVVDPVDRAEGLTVVLDHLATAFETQFRDSAARPVLREIVTPWRKALGDNADAVYHDAAVHPAGVYEITGTSPGSVYLSITVEADAVDGAFPSGTVGVLNDERIDVDDGGRFTVRLGGAAADRNWMALDPAASRLTIRQYWEDATSGAAGPGRDSRLRIRLVEGDVPDEPRAPDDESTARRLDRLATYVRARTVDLIPKPGEASPPAFVSQVPHEFPPPVPPGDHALAAADAAYSMSPYLLGPDEALVIRARWPECRCANVNLWNRFMQTFDYTRHRSSLNRAQTVLDDDGSFTVVVAHRDPGVANWLDTEGRAFGLVFWRYLLPEGDIATPDATVVPVDEAAAHLGNH